jgi:hypothetical protein
MSRLERLKEYAKPTRKENWQGAGRDQANIDRWSERATENSDGADHRATGTERAEAHSTGKKPVDRPTSIAPRASRDVDARMVDKDDLNHVGSTFMRDVRRIT